MKKYFITLYIIASAIGMTGCDEKNNQTPYVSKSLQNIISKQAAQRPPTASPQTIHIVNAPQKPPIGITVDQGHIIIDTRQTKHFLEALTQKLDGQFKQMTNSLRKNKINSPNDTGIVITKERIEVDLNKSKKFMEKWIKSMESVGEQLDSVFQELDQSFQP